MTGDPDKWLSSLMKATQGGDGLAYGELLAAITPIIQQWTKGIHSRSLEQHDIVQDILLSLHQARHTYDPTRPFLPWLASIARHRLVDAHRRAARISRHESPLPQDAETFVSADSKDAVKTPGDKDLLRRAIAELPCSQREAIEMLKLKEMSLKEASAATGISIAALKVASHRALKSLRGRLVGPLPNSGGAPDDE